MKFFLFFVITDLEERQQPTAVLAGSLLFINKIIMLMFQIDD
jgi:hypothetical protein